MLNWEYDQKAEHEAIREDGIEIGEERAREKADAERIDIAKKC